MEKHSAEKALMLMGSLNPNWRLNESATQITRRFEFADYHRTMAFVNAAAWVAHCEDHHPMMTHNYNYCEVSFWTHAIGGLSDNDFICAAKIDQVFDQQIPAEGVACAVA
ncbi:putative pterin-4-alpha-carbinolamine dehydratase [Magnetofaba australis IT-1]|uniref:Putative pterin-4-alpha-carbinolamine dehydratase n=1 Tax=Magnetofaba australis IT-1 TaxID=1434232 RepID=A0A1Y2K6Y4_9PROT|nr:putative pterin-4-alpha-carbinolamine dehydratase [Magnetofaba australis IT-1]